jgi:uncharacterized protein with NRDE domain
MCTLVLLRRPGHRWPVLIAANRDEILSRSWDAPGAYWPDRPGVVAGRDRLAGGSWLGCNATGVTAAILNRTDSLGPAAGKRSRGELVLDALDHNDAAEAAEALAAIDPNAYRTFNLVIADNRDAYWLRSRDGRSPVEAFAMPAGLSMLTSANLNDTQNFRIATYLPKFQEARVPDPDAGDWSAWRTLLSSREAQPEAGPSGAMSIVTDYGYGTSSSSLIALASPEAKARGVKDIWLFAKGRPDERGFEPVPLRA